MWSGAVTVCANTHISSINTSSSLLFSAWSNGLSATHCREDALDEQYRVHERTFASTHRQACSPQVEKPRVNALLACNEHLISAAKQHLKGRTLLLVGDSIMQQQWLQTILMLKDELVCPDSSDIYDPAEIPVDDDELMVCAHSLWWQRGVSGLQLCYAQLGTRSIVQTLSELLADQSVDAADVVLANAGLRFEASSTLREQAVELAEFVRSKQTLPRIFWRETSAEHYAEATPFGKSAKPDPSVTSCKPGSPTQPYANKYNQVTGPQLLNRVPMIFAWRTSLDDYSRHLGLVSRRDGTVTLDCTHYCLPSFTLSSWTLEWFGLITRQAPCRNTTMN